MNEIKMLKPFINGDFVPPPIPHGPEPLSSSGCRFCTRSGS